MRWLIGIGAGVIAALLVVLLVEAFGSVLYPLPEVTGAIDPREQAQWIPNQPFPAKLLHLLAWGGGTLVGAGLAIHLGARRIFAFVVALAVMLRNSFALSAMAYPGWMWFAAVLLPLAAAWAAWRYMPRRVPAAEPAPLMPPPPGTGPGPTWY
jgi:hypothetical protein